MAKRSQKPALVVLAVLLLGAAAFWTYLPEIRRLYWDLMAPDGGPEVHGSRVLRVVPQATPYERWLDGMRARMPVFEGIVIEDIATTPLRPWPNMGDGVNGLYLRLADYQITDARLLELPAGGEAAAQRHLFEMVIYCLGGPGHTLFFREGDTPLRVDWQEGSLLSVPLNVRYQHVNDGDRPVRLLAVTSFPFSMNAADNAAFVFDNEFAFTDRFDGRTDYFELAVPLDEKRIAANFVRDVYAAKLVDYPERGEGSTTLRWGMAGNSVLDLHVAEMPPDRYRKAHRHSSDAFILILSGEGYSLIWQGDDVRHRQRINWRKGTLFVPPTYWYHQHLNTGRVPARNLAINSPTLVRNLGLRFADQLEIDAPGVRAEWEAAVKARRTAQ